VVHGLQVIVKVGQKTSVDRILEDLLAKSSVSGRFCPVQVNQKPMPTTLRQLNSIQNGTGKPGKPEPDPVHDSAECWNQAKIQTLNQAVGSVGIH